MGELAGKAVVITGAGGGLGAAYARHAALLGAAIVVNDIDPASANRTVAAIIGDGGKAVACTGDVASWDFAEYLVDACISAFGTITGIVNNAGILCPAKMDQVTEADFRRIWAVNVLGTAACAQAASRRLMALGKGGSIINVVSGSHAGDVGLGTYAATKGAIASLTYSWSLELLGTGIRMNAISPRGETSMTGQNAEQRIAQLKLRPVKSSSIPAAEVNAPLVSFLLADASSGIHGQIIRISDQQLSYMTHPMIARPVLNDKWTFENVNEAFTTVLADKQHKLGLAFEESR